MISVLTSFDDVIMIDYVPHSGERPVILELVFSAFLFFWRKRGFGGAVISVYVKSELQTPQK